jgi:organic radical activating enzyme
VLLHETKEIMLERLLISPNEQKEKIEYLNELLLREASNNEIIKKLKEEQKNALDDKDKEIQTRNDQIRKLDSNIKNVERYSNELAKRTNMEAEQQESSETKASDGRK